MTCLHDHPASDRTSALHSRRAIVTAIGAAAMLAAARPAAAADASAEDERFMRMALDEARQADFPFGAVIVRDGPGYCARAQSRKDQRRSDRARRNGGDPPLPCRPWQCGAQGEYALHVRRAVRDVHGRDRMVPLRPAGLCGLGRADRREDEPDHDLERRRRGQGDLSCRSRSRAASWRTKPCSSSANKNLLSAAHIPAATPSAGRARSKQIGLPSGPFPPKTNTARKLGTVACASDLCSSPMQPLRFSAVQHG